MYDNELMLVESFESCDSSCDQREKFSRKVWEVQLDGLKKRSADRMARSVMADAITPILKKLLSEIHDYNSLPSHDLSLERREHQIRVHKSFQNLMKHLSSMIHRYLNLKITALYDEMACEIGHDGFVRPLLTGDIIFTNCEKLLEIKYGSNVEGEETVVGFDDEVQTLLDQLTATCTMQLQIISIAGMAGLGKTTLARKLYSHPLIEYMFDTRAWTCVSQTYLKRDLLLGILTSCINDVNDETYNMSDEQLGQKLYWLLKGRRYLVVFDDIWDCKTWNDLRVYFPDDNVGSRVLLTSRDIELSLHVQGAKPTHVLRLRTEDESLAIISKKVFRTGVCAPWLEGVGKVITRKCEGLPLAIVITAGILKNNWSHTWWLQISASLHSVLVRDSSQYMDSLALSYNHLPPHLRQGFVFVGIFPEDYDIPVNRSWS
ncbi:hypothetical protein QVD17_32038 [Tagetes erecta]|uniref:NB-ARC domain-containing protein n=1 Tax=Tagetes erecta TaxID=13708 RepID=A0AAD8K5J4_TARER|nr:hypothetical protein QVD17_32038 [Tagetes erecta]